MGRTRLEEIKIYGGEMLETVVTQLLIAKNEGRHAYCNFNGIILYSDNVTMDSAFKEICGCTKKEHDEKMKRMAIETQKEADLAEKKAIKNIPNQIERGKKLIYPFRFQDWKQAVASDAVHCYHGHLIENTLEIMQAIEDEKPIEEIVNIFENQGHSGSSASYTRNYVMTYSKNGYPFYEATHFGKWTLDECDAILDIMYQNEKNKSEGSEVIDVDKSKQKVISRVKRLNKLEEKSIK